MTDDLAVELAKQPHPEAKCDADGHCTVCGLPWPESVDDGPHLCPPGFHLSRTDAAKQP